MIDRIEINNFATIEHLSFDLGAGFNVITGETGAGKSVLITAVSTVLGDRADTTMVRTGSDRAFIQIAGTKNNEAVIISREILAGGKSISKLNGEMVTLGQIRNFCRDWIDIHGQYDNQQILDPENHIRIADSFHSEVITPELEKLSACYDEYRSAQKEYDDLLKAEANAARQQDYYKFEYKYIQDLGLYAGEDEELQDRLAMMKNSSRIFQSVRSSYDLLQGTGYEGGPSLLDDLSRVASDLSDIGNYSEQISSMASQAYDAYYVLDDIASGLRDLLSSLTFSEQDMDEVSGRLAAIEDTKRKYRMSVEEILEFRDELRSRLEMMQNFDSEKKRLAELAHKKYAVLESQAEHVSELRHIIAARLESAIKKELADLEFANSDFRIDISKQDEIGPLGFDKVEFLISTNPGDPLMPLTKIASGGEISRIMLAFKHIIGETDRVETMIFDEIDTGISGHTALVVGRKLAEIAGHRQIISVTHLPQIAAYGDDNYLISKSIDNAKSYTNIGHLDDEAKVRMIASLFSGSSESENALEAARELIASAK
ncbi:MAG: DNA repair protein RecN [Mogibacterium sp.]|nr:DNA repair protein RecN [Mogibacterium sp.]MBR0343554.1 DNA repair protein RecN [Oscillospiraceae bacterium]